MSRIEFDFDPSDLIDAPDDLNWCVMGTGMIARKVTPLLHAAGGCCATHVASRDIARAEAFAAEIDPGLTAVTYEDVEADEDIEAVYLTLPNHLHAEWCERLLRAGKHVLCEKPLVTGATEAERLAATSKQTGRLLVEGFMYLHHPQTLLLHALATQADSPIGRLRAIDATFCHDLRGSDFAKTRFSNRMRGGALADLGCYPISLARTLTGEEPAAIEAEALIAEPIEGERAGVDAEARVRFAFPSGVELRARCSIAEGPDITLTLTGELGNVSTGLPWAPDPARSELTLVRFDGHPEGAGESTLVIEGGGEKFTNQFAHFAACVAGEAQPVPNLRWSIDQARAIERTHAAMGLSFDQGS
ncbi:MAG: Gfo/Idh/MocA family oxidoreductase [Planctomycetota bacterium]